MAKVHKTSSAELPIVGCVGLSHLGLVTSSVLSTLGFKTICFESNKSTVDELKSLKTSINEPELDDFLKLASMNQTFTSNFDDLKQCEVIYVSDDVPTDEFGKSNTKLIKESALRISALTKNACIVILSQVNPGFTRAISSQISNQLYYQVETLIFGDAIKRSRFPERIIIGSFNNKTAPNPSLKRILDAYNCPILVFDYESAEFTKISINAFLATDVSLSNTLAEICEVSGGNWTDIVSALKLDKRIGASRYLRPGLGISGGNIERDLNTISEIALSNGLKPEIIQSIINSNSYHKSWVIRKLNQLGVLTMEKMSIGIWGLAYKENTNSIKNSPSLEIINQLPSSFYIYAHDPVVQTLSAKNTLLELVKNPEIILEKADLLLVLTPWIHYKQYANSDKLRKFSGKIIIDPFKVLDKEFCKSLGIKYLTIGEQNN